MLEGTNINPDALRTLSQMDDAQKEHWLAVARTRPVTSVDIVKTQKLSSIFFNKKLLFILI